MKYDIDRFGQCLQSHYTLHPCLQSQDVIKFCFQAAFGAEHLIVDDSAPKRFFYEEYAQTSAADELLYEPLNGIYARVHLAAWKMQGLSPDDLWNVFIHSAQESTHDEQRMLCYLKEAVKIICGESDFCACGINENGNVRDLNRFVGDKKLFLCEEWDNIVKKYIAEGIRPVHHSEVFREAYHPAYRVVKSAYLFDVMKASESFKTVISQ